MKDNFKTIIPVKLIKGKGPAGKDLMNMEGVASTPSLDSDGEYLDPNGFDTEYFLKYGFMNWNHQTNKDPLAIVGKPTSAVVNKANEFKINFKLFEDSQKALEIWNLQEILEKQGMALGLSIEGKVMERDPKDSRIVTKAQITGCAITPNPKNQDTVMSIIKGQHFGELSAYQDEDEETKEKALSAQSSSGRAIAKESLNNQLKNLSYGSNTEKISKSDFFGKIFRDLPSISIKGAQNLYDLTIKIEKSLIMKNQEDKNKDGLVSEEAIQKALEVLELGEQAPVTVSASAEAPPATEVVVEDASGTPATEVAPTADAVVIPVTEVVELEKGDALVELQKAEEKVIELKKAIDEAKVKAEEKKDDKKIVEEKKVVEKSDVNAELLKGMTALFKGEIDNFQKDINEKFKAVGTLHKSMTEQNLDVVNRLKKIEGQSVGRKSITTQKFVEKSFTNAEGLEEQKGQKKVLSVSRNKTFICDILTKSISGADGVTDQKLANEIIAFNTGNNFSNGIKKAIEDLGYSLVN